MPVPSVDQPATPCQAPSLTTFPDPIPGIIPFGTLTIFAGAPGVGKTAMLAEWCTRWRDGKTICGKPTNKPTGFYYLAADRQWRSHQQWFDLAGFPDITYYSLADDRSFDLSKLKSPQRAHECFLELVAKLNPQPGSHLFVDPLSPLFIAGDIIRPRDVASSLLQISRVAQKLLINITATAHFGKQKGDPKEQYTRPQDRIAGSFAFSGFSDTQIYLIDPVPPDQPYHILGWTPRHAAPEEFQFQRDKETGLFVPYELYTTLEKYEKALACVPTTPTAAHEIVEQIAHTLGITSRHARRYFDTLVTQGRVTKVARGVYKKALTS